LQLPSLTDPALEQLLVPLQLYHENLKNKASLESFNNTVTCDRAQRKQTETKPEFGKTNKIKGPTTAFTKGGKRQAKKSVKMVRFMFFVAGQRYHKRRYAHIIFYVNRCSLG